MKKPTIKSIKKINPYWFWILGLILIIAPDGILWVLHHIVFGMLEILETLLDEIVTHLFHTDQHTTQIIVFYIMLGMFAYLVYNCIRFCKIKFTAIKTHYPFWCEQTKAHWQQQSLSKKLGFIGKCAGFLGVIFLLY